MAYCSVERNGKAASSDVLTTSPRFPLLDYHQPRLNQGGASKQRDNSYCMVTT
ncbi:hypothetical protein J6590_040648 [Homalodisca vitripennis]|nr:hypothetical protein J6590_040648 [Homalodisca vitripennis]